MATFDLVLGKKTQPLNSEAFVARAGQASTVLLDIGTGQGKFILDAARADPETFCIGLDAVAENMAKSSRAAGVSLKKGGAPNAAFIRAAAERLPGPLAGIADTLTVQYPWGSLMRIVSQPSPDGLLGLRAVCRPGAAVSILLNYSVFEDRDYLNRLGMGDIVDPAENPEIDAAYATAGFKITRRELFHGDPPVRTAWGRHLTRGSGRATLAIDALAVEV